MTTDIETAFHTSLDRLLRGEASLDACVAAYPEHDERLRDMLVVALDLQALAPLPLDRPALQRGARLIDDELQRLRARLDRQPEPSSAWQRLTWWFPRFMPVRMAGLAAAFAIALIAYGGVTLAAVNSGPESALYGYRLTLEELRIGFASDQDKAYLYLDTAEQRLREIESAAGTGDAGAVARASTAYQEVVRKGVDVLGAVARDAQPGADRTGEVAADYRRRLAEHDTRFHSLTTKTAETQRAPITRARSRAQAGLQDVHSGPILAAAPTAAPDPEPSPTAAAPALVSSPSPTPAAASSPPVSPTPTPPTPSPTAQATPEPTATATPVPAIDITGSAVVVTGELHAVTDETLVVAGISIRRGEVATVDGAPLTARVRAEAVVAGDGSLTLVGLSVVAPAPSPEPTPTPTPAEGQPTSTPETPPTPDPTPGESTPAADVSPTPTAAEGEPTATPDTTPSPDTTPGETSPTPTPAGSEPPPTPDPTPTEGTPPVTPAATLTPEPTPQTTPSPEATPAGSPPLPSGQTPPTPSPSATPDSAAGEATVTPEPPPMPDPTPTESTPVTPAATPAPEPTPEEGAPTASETPPPAASPTPTPASTEPPLPLSRPQRRTSSRRLRHCRPRCRAFWLRSTPSPCGLEASCSADRWTPRWCCTGHWRRAPWCW